MTTQEGLPALATDEDIAEMKAWFAGKTEEPFAVVASLARIRAVLTRLEAAERRVKELREAGAVLVAKLEGIHADPDYKSVWSIAQLHIGPYVGPNYINELAAFRAALEAKP